MFEKAEQEHRNPAGHGASETLGCYYLDKPGFIQTAGSGDHCGCKRLQKATAQTSPDRTGKCIAEHSQAVFVRGDRGGMSTENAADDLDH
jgi:hypothetical protein